MAWEAAWEASWTKGRESQERASSLKRALPPFLAWIFETADAIVESLVR